MEMHRSRQFKAWVESLVADAKTGDEFAVTMAKYVYDELNRTTNAWPCE